MVRIIIAGVTIILAAGCTSTTVTSDIYTEYVEPSVFLREEIKERIAALPFQSGEVLCQNMQRLIYIGEPAIPFLIEVLEEGSPRARGSCAFMLGQLSDRRTIPDLQRALGDPVPAVRYEVATALCVLGVQDGYPVLISGLSDDEIRLRYKAHEALQMLTRLDYGYRHDDDPGQRRVAVARWEQWWERMRASEL